MKSCECLNKSCLRCRRKTIVSQYMEINESYCSSLETLLRDVTDVELKYLTQEHFPEIGLRHEVIEEMKRRKPEAFKELSSCYSRSEDYQRIEAFIRLYPTFK